MNGLGIPEQGIDGLSERGQVSLDHTPDDLVVHRCVTVDQDVAERNDPAMIRNSCRNVRFVPGESGKRFSDDFELPLHGRPQQFVHTVIVELLAFAEARDAIGRALDIKQVFPRFKPNRARSFPARRAGGSRGFRALPG